MQAIHNAGSAGTRSRGSPARPPRPAPGSAGRRNQDGRGLPAQRPVLRRSARETGRDRRGGRRRAGPLEELESTAPEAGKLWLLQNLAAAKRLLVEHRDAGRKHLAEAGESCIRGQFQQSLQRWEHDLENFAREGSEALARQNAVLASSPGAGPVHIATLLATMPELGRLNRHAAGRLLGVAPCAQDSSVR